MSSGPNFVLGPNFAFVAEFLDTFMARPGGPNCVFGAEFCFGAEFRLRAEFRLQWSERPNFVFARISSSGPNFVFGLNFVFEFCLRAQF